MSFPDETGHVPQNQLERGDLNNGYAHYNFPLLVEGVVVAAYYPDDPDAQKRSVTGQMEYDVDPTSIMGMGRLRRVVRADTMSGLDDGDDNVLRVASKPVSDGAFSKDGGGGVRPTRRYESDGDRVLVGFVNGNLHRGIILGVLTHTKSRRRWKTVRGEDLPRDGKLIRRVRHRGTELVIDDSGNATVDFGAHPSKQSGVEEKKALTIKLGDFTVKIDNTASPTVLTVSNGNGEMVKVAGDQVELAGGGAAVTRVGDSWNISVNQLTAAMYPVQGTMTIKSGSNKVKAG